MNQALFEAKLAELKASKEIFERRNEEELDEEIRRENAKRKREDEEEETKDVKRQRKDTTENEKIESSM